MNLLDDINQKLNENDKQSWGSIMNFTPISENILQKRIDSYIKTSTLKQEIRDTVISHLNAKSKETFKFNKAFSIGVISFTEPLEHSIDMELRMDSEGMHNSITNLKSKIKSSSSYKKLVQDVHGVMRKHLKIIIKDNIPDQQNPRLKATSGVFKIGMELTCLKPEVFNYLKQPKDEIAKEIAYKITALAHASKSSTKQVLTDIVGKVEGVSLPAHHLESKPDQLKP